MGETGTVEFGPDQNDNIVLRLSVADPTGVGEIEMLNVEGDGLRFSRGVPTLGGDGLDRFLSGLAADWRGWDGTRRWDALENTMSIEATHKGGRVELLVIVRRDSKLDAWQVRLPILIDSGESLARLAEATVDLLALREHS